MKPLRRRLLITMIPILIGLGGLLFSRQFEDIFIRVIVVVLSVAVPVFTAGHLLARHRTSARERILLFLGVLLLVVGAAFSASGITESLAMADRVTPFIGTLSRTIGLFSLLLGLFAVLLSVIRTGEDIQAIGERFWHLAEHITEGFILSAPDGTILLVNRRFLEMSGLQEDEVVGQNAWELARRLNVQNMEEHLQKRAKGIASEYEVTWMVRGEERRYWFSGSPIFDRQGRHTANLATVRDVTEHHQLSRRVEKYAESLQEIVEEQTRQLRRSEERFRQLLLSMNEGFVTIDGENRVVFANERICQMLETDRESMLGQELFDFLDPGDRLRFLNILARSNTSGTGARQEINLLTATGLAFPAVVAVTFIPDPPEGQPVHSLVVTSVADLKAMQRQLESRAQELEAANEELQLHGRAKDAFLSNVSHELRTPLSTIQGYVEMLATGSLGTLESAQQNALRVMDRNIHRLLALINEMIDFSRMEIRGVQINAELFVPEKLVQECVASAHPSARAKQITLSVRNPSDTYYCWGDTQRLGQVLGILLNNAVKFTPENGTIKVACGTSGEKGIYFSVADSGIGIDAAYHERIFDKFFQVDSSPTRRFEGTGIGLSIAKSIVEAHQGSITLESHPGEGTAFTVTLPLARMERPDQQDAVAELAGARVLVAADSKTFRKAIGGLLEEWKMEVGSAKAGHQAVRTAEETAPQVILLNDSASDPAGTTTLPLLRNTAVTRDIPVVVATSDKSTRVGETGERRGGVVYLEKPFQGERLADCLAQALEGMPDPASHGPGLGERDGTLHRTQVLVVDSDPGFLEWAETALHRRLIPCCCAPNLDKALQVVDHEALDVILLNWDEPDVRTEDQLQVLREHKATRGVPVYLMTGMPGVTEGLEGSAGLLKKPFGMDTLVASIEKAREQRQTVGSNA